LRYNVVSPKIGLEEVGDYGVCRRDKRSMG
jgi:hypothetical protein